MGYIRMYDGGKKKRYKLPKEGVVYHHYDDGKISLFRQDRVLIKKIYKFCDAPKKYQKRFEFEASEYEWIYKKRTPYLIVGSSLDYPENGVPIYALTKNNTWFSFTDKNHAWGNEGLLDIEGDMLHDSTSDFILLMTNKFGVEYTNGYKDCIKDAVDFGKMTNMDMDALLKQVTNKQLKIKKT